MKKILFIVACLIIFSCEKNENIKDSELGDQTEDTANNIINQINDYETSTAENQLKGSIIGKVTNQKIEEEKLIFNIVEQFPNDAVTINEKSGELIILNENIFNYESNKSIIGKIVIINKEKYLSKVINFKISITDIEEPSLIVNDIFLETTDLNLKNKLIGSLDIQSPFEKDFSYEIFEEFPKNSLKIDTSSKQVFSELNISTFISNPIISGKIKIKDEYGKEVISQIKVNLIHSCDTNSEKKLSAFYPFNNNSKDESGNNNNGIKNNVTLTSDRKSNSNSAYYFNGIDSKIDADDSPVLYLGKEFTISAWIFPEEIKTQTIVRKGSHVRGVESWPYGLGLSASNDIIFSITSNNKLTQVRKHGYGRFKWYLITGVLKNQKMYLYVNDELVGVKGIEGEIYDDVQPLIIGTRLAIPSSTFKGKIDDVRIYKSALCKEDIDNLYNNK